MSKLNVRKFTGYTAIFLSGIYFCVAGVALAFFREKADLVFDKGLLVTYWSLVLSLLIVYIVDTSENHDETVLKALDREYPGAEVFRDADSFIPRLIEVTVGAESVCTLNYSPPMGASVALDGYFAKLHEYMKSEHSKLRNFRSIASIENEAKARWILDRSHMFLGNPRISLACFPERNNTANLMCFHIVQKGDVGYVFFYPPVPLTGVMNAFLIINNDICKLMKEQFEIVWSQTTLVLIGGTPYAAGVELLSKLAKTYDARKLGTLKSRAISN